MALKIVIPAAILSALILGMFSIIFPKVEANVEPGCVLKHGDGSSDPHLAPKKDLPDLKEEANRFIANCLLGEHRGFTSIVCGTVSYLGPDDFLVAVQGLVAGNGSMLTECSARFYRGVDDYCDRLDFPKVICPPVP